MSAHPRARLPFAAILPIVAVLCLPACSRQEEPAADGPQGHATAPRPEATAPADIVRPPGETAALFAKRVVPQGMATAFEPVEISCGPPGASLVMLFRPADSLSNYTGWVLYPAGSDPTRYHKAVLPAMDEAPGLFDITLKAVFADEADRTPGPELIVLYQYYRTGSGSDPEHAAYVYRWTNGSFEVDSKASSSLVGLQNEPAVRAKLAALRK